MCDFVVDPVCCESRPEECEVAHERFQGASSPSSASDARVSRVLGLSVQEFAPAVAALTDYEEMVLALVHPLVQVYSIPRTGQLAYVGHICNFRQKVMKFLSSLPVMPRDMPFVQVRPRKFKGHPGGKSLFKVDVRKLRAAFVWLRQHNPYYFNVDWREDAAAAWESDDVVIGVTREIEHDPGQAPPISGDCLRRWLDHAKREATAGDAGYAIGRRLLETLVGEAGEEDADFWNLARRMVADVFGHSAYRIATSFPQDVFVVALCAREILDLALPKDQGVLHTLKALRTLDTNACPLELDTFRAEVDAVMLELSDEDPELVHTGATAAPEVGDDVGLRESAVDSLAAIAEQLVQEPGAAPVSASASHQDGAVPTPDPRPERGHKYPRVDPPEVEDEPGQAVREDTPGYIAKAFPKLFPHGCGDYHGDHCGLSRSLRFEEWGRYVMLWHDSRFMQHTRFRYWLLDTMLRVMAPGVQRVFFRTRKACQDFTLESLMDQQQRRQLVQQMSSVTNMIPGSIGERRQMRQHLEAMVHQVEDETADLGMNGGAGRIPAGFCTLTCAVYKWSQLHETLLKSYPSGPSDNPAYREHYIEWLALPPGAARECAMRKAYYKLAVREPGAVAWYCALKLEMAVSLVKAMLTEQMRSDEVPGREEAKAKLAEDLASRLGEEVVVEDVPDLQQFGYVDDYYVSFEWSDGGMIHAHMALWITGAPRIDKIEVPRTKSSESGDGNNWVEIDVVAPGAEVAPQAEAAARLATFWDRAFTEFNVAKAMAITEGEAEPQSTSCSSAGLRPRWACAKQWAQRRKEAYAPRRVFHMRRSRIACWRGLTWSLKMTPAVGKSCMASLKDAHAFRRRLCRKISASQALLALTPGGRARDFIL